MIYFSPSKNGFYDDAIHGARRITFVDQEALDREVAKVTGGAGPDEIEDEDERAEIRAKVAELIANPPTEVVDNPACQIPVDAIEITAELHTHLMEDLSDGKVLSADKKGRPIAVDPDISIEEQLANIRRRRDRELKRTDWTQHPDALAAAKRELWAEHRQALRDLPALVEKALKAKKPVPEFPEPPGQ
jgi:hypothetical protein